MRENERQCSGKQKGQTMSARAVGEATHENSAERKQSLAYTVKGTRKIRPLSDANETSEACLRA